jgi:hypothetical protein
MYLLSLYIRYYILIQSIEIQSLLWYQSTKLLTHNFSIFTFPLSFSSFTLSMASNSAVQFVPPNIGQLMTFKLEGPNYITWSNQVTPILKTNDLMGFVDGSEPCPPKYVLDDQGKATTTLSSTFLLWTKKDQFVLSWLNATLTEKVMSTTFGVTSAQQLWDSLSSCFASHSKTRISHLQRQLQSLHQGSKGCSEYIEAAKQFSAQLAAVGQRVAEDALIGYVVGGLHPSFNPMVTSLFVASRYKSLTFSEFQDELLSYELLLDSQTASNTADSHQFAMFSSKPPANNYSRKAKASGKRWNGPKHTSSPKYHPTSSSLPARPPCQICGKLSHQALDCFHRMDHAFQGHHPPAQLSAMIATSNQAAENGPWYADSAANQHITANLENLSLQ